MTKKLVIIIPTFNEEKCIISTLNDITQKLKNKVNYEIIVVDDGSTDKTVALIKNSNFLHIKVIEIEKNRGKGFAVKKGVISSTGDFFLFMDADNSTKIDEFFKFISYLNKYDVIIGSRGLSSSIITVKQPFLKNMLGNLSSLVVKTALCLDYKDTQCGFKLFKAGVAQDIFNEVQQERWSFDFEALKIAQRKGYKVLEMPVVWENNFNSSVRPLDYVKTLGELLVIRQKYKND